MLALVKFMSRGQAEKIDPAPSMVIISITDPDREPAQLKEGFADILRVGFWDIDRTVTGYDPITYYQAAMIVNFLNKWHEAQERYQLLVHCEAGISRSAAVALFAIETYGAKRVQRLWSFGLANNEVLRKLRRMAGSVPLGVEVGEE